ncbi:MAG: hypothetical protein MZV63_62530 [Marinilabiliales bacterium]|nr:hypothetical protein [Marinilabiliales bacterium]
MELNLKKPLVILDLETTGVSIASDRIVEFSAMKVTPGGDEEWLTMRINPGHSDLTRGDTHTWNH